jgi:hypothetical protein
MKVNDVIGQFEIYTSNKEREVLERLKLARPLSSFSEQDQFTIEGLIRKSLVIKIGDHNPRVIANEHSISS